MEGKEPRLGEKQEETFAGGEQREPGPTRVEGAVGAGGGLGNPQTTGQAVSPALGAPARRTLCWTAGVS